MAKVQLSPEQQASISDLFYELCHDPKTRKKARDLIKDRDPALAAQFADVTVDERMEEFEAKQADKELKRQQDEHVRRLSEQRAALIADGKYTEDQVKEMETGVMARYGLSDYKAAATLYASENPPATPTPPALKPGGATWEFPSVEVGGKVVPFADFAKDPAGASRNAAFNVIEGFGRSRRA
jgi:hypothetical protein